MKTISNEIIWVDVDGTLILNDVGTIEIDFYGEKMFISPHEPNIRFMKSLKSRGYYIIVHSGNGFKHAETVVKALGLSEYVDQCMSKPAKIMDDKPLSDWAPNPICLKLNGGI